MSYAGATDGYAVYGAGGPPTGQLSARCNGSVVCGEPAGVGTGLLAFPDHGVGLLGGALNGSLRQKRVEGPLHKRLALERRRTPRASERNVTAPGCIIRVQTETAIVERSV